MPQCRRDQRTFAIFLVVMVTIETLLIFTVMHLEHRAAEREAERQREERQEARDEDPDASRDLQYPPLLSEEISAELDDAQDNLRKSSGEKGRARSQFSRRKRAARNLGKRKQTRDRDTKNQDNDPGLLERVEVQDDYLPRGFIDLGEIWENPDFESVPQVKELVRDRGLSRDLGDASWMVDGNARAKRRLFVKESDLVLNRDIRLLSQRNLPHHDVRGQKSSFPPSQKQLRSHAAVNFYRDVTSL